MKELMYGKLTGTEVMLNMLLMVVTIGLLPMERFDGAETACTVALLGVLYYILIFFVEDIAEKYTARKAEKEKRRKEKTA